MDPLESVENLLREGKIDDVLEIVSKQEEAYTSEKLSFNKARIKNNILSIRKKLEDFQKIYTNTPDQILHPIESKVETIKLNRTIYTLNNLLITDTNIPQSDIKSVSITIESLRNLDLAVILESEGSLFVRNCQNCKLIAKAHQIRLFNCINLDLTIFTQTGTFMEESSDIKIRPLSPESLASNLYSNVHDFTYPFDSVNFQIFDQ